MNNIQHFTECGFRTYKKIVPDDELDKLRSIYDDFLNGKYEVGGLRSDLSGSKARSKKVENITQIIRPSLFEKELEGTKTYQKALKIAKELMGDDMAMDLDMFINKAPNTKTETPWQQDGAYYPKLKDKRAVSFWIALDDVNKENGCMMYVLGSHRRPLKKHGKSSNNQVLVCEIDKDADISYGEIIAGSGIAHHGNTIHGALGNTSKTSHRRAIVINFRPKSMVENISNLDSDQLSKKEVRNKKG